MAMRTKASGQAHNKIQILLIAPLLFGLISVNVYVTYHTFTSKHPGANDFYSRWVGGCALLREGLNPYSETATLRIQQGVYGRPARPGEDQVAFAYPLYSLLFFWPLCSINNYPLVQAIWWWVLLAALVTATALSMRVVGNGRGLPLWLQILTIFWSVFLYHALRAIILGQLAVFVLLALVAALWAMRRGHDGWAGLFLALSTIKPQMVYLAIPWILLWAAGKKRWRLWWGFGISLTVLVLGSMPVLPSWIPDFVQQVLNYPSYTVYGSLTWMIVQDWLGLGRTAEIVVLAALALGILAGCWRLWRGSWEQMLWMVGLLLLLTNFFTTRIATTNYILLLPWAIWGFQEIRIAWKRAGTWAVIFIQATSLVGLWALFLATVKGDFEQAPVYLPFPIAMLLLLAWLWTRIQPAKQASRRGWAAEEAG
jgi:Glycosyltransferase family 87